MGIRGLGKFLSECAPGAVKQQVFQSFLGRVIAIDASMSLYQFIIAIRDGDHFGNLTNEAGEVTSHISGFLSRAIRLLENGIKPVYVFDGKPMDLKSSELAKRRARREKAEEDLQRAKEAGDAEEIKKYIGRTVRVTEQHNQDVKELLMLMGLPVIIAPTEAEAQCARMAADGIVYATATEDADALTFGSPILIRHLNFADQQSRGKPILMFTLKAILEELGLTMEQFVDFCILCGCDYCERFKGIGPQTAYKLVKKHKTLDGVLEALEKSQGLTEAEKQSYLDARQFFLSPTVTGGTDLPKLTWKEPQEEALKAFLVEKHNFNPTRVDAFLNRLRNARGKVAQTRLENFFGAAPLPSGSLKTGLAAKKQAASTIKGHKRVATSAASAKKRLK